MPAEAARPAHADDAERLRALADAAEAELRHARGATVYLEREALSGDAIVALLDHPEACVLVGTLDETVVGVGTATVESLRDGSVLGVIGSLYVEPEAREVGVGEELLSALVAWCAARGAAGVDSLALPGERDTKNFYEAAGFKARLLTVHHRIDRGGER